MASGRTTGSGGCATGCLRTSLAQVVDEAGADERLGFAQPSAHQLADHLDSVGNASGDVAGRRILGSDVVGRGKMPDQVPEEPDVAMMLGAIECALPQLVGGQPVQLIHGRPLLVAHRPKPSWSRRPAAWLGRLAP